MRQKAFRGDDSGLRFVARLAMRRSKSACDTAERAVFQARLSVGHRIASLTAKWLSGGSFVRKRCALQIHHSTEPDGSIERNMAP